MSLPERRCLAGDVPETAQRPQHLAVLHHRVRRQQEDLAPTCQALIYPALDFSFETQSHRELADGHASFRFSAYVSLSAGSANELEAACAEVEQAAGLAHLELERLHAQQELAFTYTLPLCEGLA